VKRLPDPVPACVYCGAPTRGAKACSAHRDLVELDPAMQAERPAAAGGEQGARDHLRIGRKAYRRELY
jgi:hypothetical protein